ncbi:hypothetical protein B0A55_06013 [Friedmanniomyces simplex]|uniref:Non-homologous end-joining factor 1 n=1 Tax=Friedmanniomyces simplex TaxID=329884 RepID=A0A4U0XGM7_9PEZI|nr:hypothetical protein B0A55_06013 [Friedmanniomyces simplex]
MSARWRSLPLDDTNIPHLLIKAKLSSSGYTIHLTDLSRVWGETLTKREIKVRALLEECSIDPSEGDDQYQILLDKIQQAIDQLDGSSFELGPAKGVEGGLVLSLSAPLPSPLPVLRWQIHVSPLPPTALESSLIRPLLQHAQTLQSRIQSLVHELTEKDRVISKITDRLETSGNDLTAVFPGVSNIKVSRKNSQREQLARHVRGLGDFDESAWQAQQRTVQGNGVLEGRELDGLLRGLPEGSTDEERNGDWWRMLSAGVGSKPIANQDSQLQRHVASQRIDGPATNGLADPNDDVAMTDGNDPDEDFQRQGTPPHLKATKNVSRDVSQVETSSLSRAATNETQVTAEDESTEDDDDLDAPPRKLTAPKRSGTIAQVRQRTAIPDTAARPSSKLRATGGGGPQSLSPAKNSLPQPQTLSLAKPPRGKLGAIGGEAKASATPGPAPEPAAASPAKPRAKLGAIGGKSKAVVPSPDPTSDPTLESSTPSPAMPQKLGTLGGKKNVPGAASTSTSRQPSEAPSTASTANDGTPARQSRGSERRTVKAPTPPTETSQERADRKRLELKRQLDESAAKGAGKKKRKF